jgi:hypothetical protein
MTHTMPNTTPNTSSIQNEVAHYTQFAWNEGESLLAELSAARDGALATTAEHPSVDPALLTFTMSETSKPSVGFRRIELSGYNATGFVEINRGSVGLVHCEIKNKHTGGSVFDVNERLTQETRPKALDELSHKILRALLLA